MSFALSETSPPISGCLLQTPLVNLPFAQRVWVADLSYRLGTRSTTASSPRLRRTARSSSGRSPRTLRSTRMPRSSPMYRRSASWEATRGRRLPFRFQYTIRASEAGGNNYNNHTNRPAIEKSDRSCLTPRPITSSPLPRATSQSSSGTSAPARTT